MKKINKLKLDSHEKELLDSFDKSEWRSVKNIKNEINTAKKAAKNTLHKDAKINISLSSNDLTRIKQKAALSNINC